MKNLDLDIEQINMENEILIQALHYAKEFGWLVLPLHSIDAENNCTCGNVECDSAAKHPVTALVPNGSKNATRDENIIHSWFTGKNYNLGIATGEESNLAVLDIDNDKGGENGKAELIEKTGSFPNTISVRTGNGFHYYFRYPKGLRNSSKKLGVGLDIRGSGGYVVAPPSIHLTGRTYEFSQSSTELFDFPSAWLEILLDKPPANGNGLIASAPKTYEVPTGILSGGRNDALTAMAGKLRHSGFSDETIEMVLLRENQNLCNPPLAEREVKQIARSANRNFEPGIVYTNKVQDETILNWDDITISKLFVSDNKDSIRFNPESKKFYTWEGSHWEMDRTDKVIVRASEFSQGLYKRASSLVSNSAEMKDANRQISRSNSSNGLKAFVDLSKSYLSISSSAFDRNPYLFNCQNGSVDLRTGELLPHNADDYQTYISNFPIDKNCPIINFTRFLEMIQPNPLVRKFIQRCLGYSLLGVSRERAFWILYGSGNNGKSIFIDLFARIFGTYASSTTSASIMQQKGDHIPNDIARLKGKRFAVIPETAENEKINAPLLKALSAGDTVTARYLFAEYFDFEFTAKIWIATNHKPTVTDHSKGFWDRLKIIPFTVDIPKTEVIKRDDLLASLFAEAPGILAWAVEGCLEYFRGEDLQVPQSIQDEIELYKYEQDSIAQFIDECCEKDSHFETNNIELYQRYSDFCRDTGEWKNSQKKLSIKLKERGFEQGITSGRRFWKGLQLK